MSDRDGPLLRLRRVGNSALYAPPDGARYAFLLWAPAGMPEPELPREQTWADLGEPQRIGYYAFLPSAPDESTAPVLEQRLRERLDPPATTGFVWARGQPEAPVLLATVALVLDDDRRPRTKAAVTFELPKGTITFGLEGAMAVRATRLADGTFTGVAFTRESAAGTTLGVELPLLGSSSGVLRFAGFLASKVTARTTVKALAAVSLDPVFPFDPTRTRITDSGRRFRVSVDGDGVYHLSPVSSLEHPS